MCANKDTSDTAIYMADAYNIKKLVNNQRNGKITKSDLLNLSNPFHCMFCCQLPTVDAYISRYFPNQDNLIVATNDKLPAYVNMLLRKSSSIENPDMYEVIKDNRLDVFRTVGVYDMSDAELSLNLEA